MSYKLDVAYLREIDLKMWQIATRQSAAARF